MSLLFAVNIVFRHQLCAFNDEYLWHFSFRLLSIHHRHSKHFTSHTQPSSQFFWTEFLLFFSLLFKCICSFVNENKYIFVFIYIRCFGDDDDCAKRSGEREIPVFTCTRWEVFFVSFLRFSSTNFTSHTHWPYAKRSKTTSFRIHMNANVRKWQVAKGKSLTCFSIFEFHFICNVNGCELWVGWLMDNMFTFSSKWNAIHVFACLCLSGRLAVCRSVDVCVCAVCTLLLSHRCLELLWHVRSHTGKHNRAINTNIFLSIAFYLWRN